jgi:hypothetical protein
MPPTVKVRSPDSPFKLPRVEIFMVLAPEFHSTANLAPLATRGSRAKMRFSDFFLKGTHQPRASRAMHHAFKLGFMKRFR